jgi:LEA14-like dessication related protein
VRPGPEDDNLIAEPSAVPSGTAGPHWGRPEPDGGRVENTMHRSFVPGPAALLFAAAFLVAGCGSLADIARGLRKPQARVLRVEIEDLTFEAAALRADVEITNPNPVGIELAGYDYELAVEGRPLLAGAVEQKTALVAGGQSVIVVPVAVSFANLFSAVETAAGQEELAYRLSAGLSFDLPVLGRVRVPVATEGRLPVVRPPAVRVVSLRVPTLTLSGATLVLGLELENRNGFGLEVEGLQYSFSANGQAWASGSLMRPLAVGPRGSARLELEMRLGFASLGRSVYQLLASGGPIGYELEGALDIGTSLDLLPRASLPLELSGEIRLMR